MADAGVKHSRGRNPMLTDSARKKRKKETNARINKSRIYLGDQYDRWLSLKEELNVQTHAEVAKVLLDRILHDLYKFILMINFLLGYRDLRIL